jgi:RNA polymerase sigma-70 factor (ECF subfamily)
MAAPDNPVDQYAVVDAVDAELMIRIVSQDQTALMVLYQRFGSQVYGLALRVLRDPQLAEEATQDTFLKVWHKSEQWNPARGQLSSWLLTIARYAAIDRLRREQRHVSSSGTYLDDLADHAIAPAQMGDRRWLDGQLLRQFLLVLPQDQALVIELAFYQGMTHSELAEHLQWPLGTVKTRLRSGLQKLRLLWIEAQEQEVQKQSGF